MAILDMLRRGEGLTETERVLADFIMERSDDVLAMSIGEFSRETCSSNATVVRFARKLGASGFRDLRVKLAAELEHERVSRCKVDADVPFGEGEAPSEVMGSIAALLKAAVDDAYGSVSPEAISQAARYVWEAETVYLFATGDSLMSGLAFSNLLMKLGVHVVLANQYGEEVAHAYTSSPGDVALFASYSGRLVSGDVMFTALRVLRERGCRTVWISSAPSPGRFDVELRFPSRELRAGKVATWHSQMCIKYLLDCIYGFVWSFDYENNSSKKATIDGADIMLGTLLSERG